MHYCVVHSFSCKMTPRSCDFDEGFLILEQFFWGNVIFKICHSCLNSHNWPTKNFYCLASPGRAYLLLLWKAKPAWIKRSIHYVTLHCYNPGSYSKKFLDPYLNRDFWYKRSKFWKLHCLRKMALESKRLHQNHWSWCHFAGKRMYYAVMHSLIWFSLWFLWN